MKYSLKGISVAIGIPTNRDPPIETVISLFNTVSMLSGRGISHELQIVSGNSIVEIARSRLANIFLKSDMNRLFMIDSDIVWKPEEFMNILALSSVLECVGASYPAKTDPPMFLLNMPRDDSVIETNEHGCFEMGGFGLGFTCVQRKVLEQLAERSPKVIFPGDDEKPVPKIFRCDIDDEGVFRGEDIAFFADIRGLGYKANMYPQVQLGHVGPHTYRGDLMSCLERDGPKTYEVPKLENEDAPGIEAVGSEAGSRSEAA